MCRRIGVLDAAVDIQQLQVMQLMLASQPSVQSQQFSTVCTTRLWWHGVSDVQWSCVGVVSWGSLPRRALAAHALGMGSQRPFFVRSTEVRQLSYVS